MSSDEFKQLKDQVKLLESHLKVFQNHLYILQNDFQYNQKNYQLEIAKQQNQITNLASLVLDIVKDNRHVEEARENQVLQKITNILNIDVTNEFASLTGAGGTSGTNPLNSDSLSSIAGLTLNPSSGSNQSSNGSTSNPNSFLNPHNRVNSNDQNLLTPSSNQLSIQQQIQQSQQQQHQQQQQQQQHLIPQHQRQIQPQPQQQLQQQHHQQQQQHHQHHQQQQKRKANKQRESEPETTDAAALLDDDDPLDGYTQETQQQPKPIQQLRPSLSNQAQISSARHIPIAINPNSEPPITESPKRRKVYEKDYAFIKAPSSVEEIWNEYSVGLNNQPSIRQLEEEYKTGWRRDPATSKKFNRRKAIYRAIEKGLEKGYSLQNCIQLLEDYRYIDREKNLKQPIGWLCHGNLPEELK